MLLSDMRQMFRWAGRRLPWRKLLEVNPVEDIKPAKIVSRDYGGNERTRSLSDVEIRELYTNLEEARYGYLAAADKRTAPQPVARRTEAAIWIMLSTCCRVGEISRARWQDVDFEKSQWVIPRENAKNGVEHTIYLSDMAKQWFKVLQLEADDSPWCLPAAHKPNEHVCLKSISKQVRDRQIAVRGKAPMSNRSKAVGALMLSGGRWTPHDLRRTGSTIMQSLKITPEAIDKCLNHVESNRLKRVYQTYDYAEEKRAAWIALGARLEQLMNYQH